MDPIKSSLRHITKEEAMKNAYDLGFEYEKYAHYCPQACFAALSDVFCIQDDDDVFRSLFGFHGGAGDSGIGMCGGLVGGIAAISYFFGRNKTEFVLGVPNCYATGIVKRLVDEFRKEFDGVTCRDCLAKKFGKRLNFWDKKDVEFYEAANGHEDKCSVIVGIGASMAAGILWDELFREERIEKKMRD